MPGVGDPLVRFVPRATQGAAAGHVREAAALAVPEVHRARGVAGESAGPSRREGGGASLFTAVTTPKTGRNHNPVCDMLK